MNSANYKTVRSALDCRPRYGWAVDKELTLLRIHFGFYLQLTRGGKNSSLDLEQYLLRKQKNQRQDNYKGSALRLRGILAADFARQLSQIKRIEPIVA